MIDMLIQIAIAVAVVYFGIGFCSFLFARSLMGDRATKDEVRRAFWRHLFLWHRRWWG